MPALLTQNLGDVGVVHVWAGLEDLPPLILGPDHERIHRALDVLAAVAVLARLTDDLGPEHLGCNVDVQKLQNRAHISYAIYTHH